MMKDISALPEEEQAVVLAQRAYKKEWRDKNKDKVKASNERFYKRVKEKEPATAATVTDSQKTDVIVEDNTVSISKDNTGSQKSQGILEEIRRDLLQIYENMNEAAQHAWDLGEMYQKIRTALKEGGNEDT